ncbi:MAG: outer rane receptor for ferrienterochelin and colicin [Gammaproteobacteria bacterium]|nr:outer rane receptor for ferrienterochelin and colicin [Gammaproteobacteria bacterium]
MRTAALAILATAFLSVAAAQETVIVTTTRVPSLVGDEPIRIEAVPSEEIEENLTVQPGNISTLLNELPSARIQSAAPGLGGVGLQLRGMPTRHTLVLTDGLPLLGAEPDDFGLLQTPPLDLQRIELIKGAASALYGGSALGGVLNIVSKSPQTPSAMLANATSRGGRDLEGFFTQDSLKDWTGTLTAGVHDQSRQDVNGDGWADIPGFRRYSLRPRIWWKAGTDQSLFLTGGVTEERREGGTMLGRVLAQGAPDALAAPFAEVLHTRRFDGGAVAYWKLNDAVTLNSRLSFTSADQDRTFGRLRIPSTQTTIFSEQAFTGDAAGHQWALGLAFQHEALRVAAVSGVGYTYNVPGVFAQDEFSPSSWIKLAAAARVDSNNQYGTYASPRLSALFRQPGSPWSLRASAGGGFAAPTPFVDEVQSTSLGVLTPLRGLHAERAVTESLDGKWAVDEWDVNVSVFNSQIHNPLEARPVAGERIELVNAAGSRKAPGGEVLIHYVAGALQMIGSWSYINATQAAPDGSREPAPLVPRHSAELGGILESETRGRIGLEANYIGTQGLEDDPYRTLSRPYILVNALAEIRFSGFSIFINAINLTGTRQTHYDPLIRPAPGWGGDPITDVWAPLDGRTFNIGIRTGQQDHAQVVPKS